MNYIAILYFLGYILRIEALALLPALCIALSCGENRAAEGLVLTFILAGCLSMLAAALKKYNRTITHREGFVIVALSWLVMSLVGAIPFTYCGAIPSYLDALFETVSGFTTTGSSILTDVEALPLSLP